MKDSFDMVGGYVIGHNLQCEQIEHKNVLPICNWHLHTPHWPHKSFRHGYKGETSGALLEPPGPQLPRVTVTEQ